MMLLSAALLLLASASWIRVMRAPVVVLRGPYRDATQPTREDASDGAAGSFYHRLDGVMRRR